MALRKMGYKPTLAGDAFEAQQQIVESSPDAICCVLTDYHMPKINGLDLLAWIQVHDPNLSTILVTAQNERELITRSIRGGAVDFLEKPIDIQRLKITIAQAAARTRQLRAFTEMDGSIQNLSRTQKRMLLNAGENEFAKIRLCYRPKLKVGGDFFTNIKIAPGKHFFILTDVSGHDLQSAYVSANFHGALRALLHKGSTPDEIFAYFNDFLVNEWNQSDSSTNDCRPTSIGLSAILLDITNLTATLWTYGAPSPICSTERGNLWVGPQTASCPLGWFPALSRAGVSQSVENGELFLMWTDGLDDLAMKLDINPVSLAFALQRSDAEGKNFPEASRATDDILLASVRLTGSQSAPFEPILMETFGGSQWNQMESFQAVWERSLKTALPDLDEKTLFNIVLAVREALLNSLTHGCGHDENKFATLQISYQTTNRRFRAIVQDDGPGHDFDIEQQCKRDSIELVDEHRGLMLIKRLVHSLEIKNSGRTVIMEFQSPS